MMGDMYVPVHGELHFLLVIRDGFVDLMELEPKLGTYIPPERGTNDPSPKEVEARIFIAHHKSKVLGYIIHQDFQRMFGSDVLLGAEDSVTENPLIY